MSADTYIYIDKETFEVWLCVASWLGGEIEDQKSAFIGKGKNIEEAIEIAEKYEEENPGLVEYGISFKLWYK